jgi:hypothetical protein
MGILTKSKNGFYAVPAIASGLIPGLGQFFKKQYGKGIAFLGIFLGWGYITMFPAFLISLLPGILPIIGILIPVIGILLWFINVLDAAFNSVGQRY